MNSHPLNRKERDRQIRRNDILKAAEQVFAAQGYQKATIKDIAARAQYAAGTVYLYFKDKEDLYHALLDEKSALLFSMLMEKVGPSTSAADRLQAFAIVSFEFFEKNHDFSKIFLLENDNLTEEKRFFASPSGRAFLAFLVDMVKKAQEANIVRTDMKPEQLEIIFREIFKAITLHWLEKPADYCHDSRKAAAMAIDIFLNGAARK